mmetsp:Transcript_14200/g.35256  ORF Transcript_14200/g.35256 Transcript_14200/m.35256 type:complete len:294 (-) Transcript_14200:902-1783(-)
MNECAHSSHIAPASRNPSGSRPTPHNYPTNATAHNHPPQTSASLVSKSTHLRLFAYVFLEGAHESGHGVHHAVLFFEPVLRFVLDLDVQHVQRFLHLVLDHVLPLQNPLPLVLRQHFEVHVLLLAVELLGVEVLLQQVDRILEVLARLRLLGMPRLHLLIELYHQLRHVLPDRHQNLLHVRLSVRDFLLQSGVDFVDALIELGDRGAHGRYLCVELGHQLLAHRSQLVLELTLEGRQSRLQSRHFLRHVVADALDSQQQVVVQLIHHPPLLFPCFVGFLEDHAHGLDIHCELL